MLLLLLLLLLLLRQSSSFFWVPKTQELLPRIPFCSLSFPSLVFEQQSLFCLSRSTAARCPTWRTA